MYFRALTIYRITDTAKLLATDINAELSKRAFVPMGASDRMAAGWVPPMAHAPDLHAFAHQGCHLIALKTEEKLMPASVVKELAEERISEIEEREVRKIGRKEAKEIRERVTEELLPRAFSKSRVLHALIDLKSGFVMVNTATAAKAELLTQLLRETLGSLPTKLLHTQLDPVTAMTTWLEHEAPDCFTLDSDVTLKSPGDGGAVANIRRQDLNAEEVTGHLKSGKLVTRLAMSHADRLSFVLNDKLQLARIAFLDLIEDQIKDLDADDAAAMAEGTLAITVASLRELVYGVLAALGGELGVNADLVTKAQAESDEAYPQAIELAKKNPAFPLEELQLQLGIDYGRACSIHAQLIAEGHLKPVKRPSPDTPW